MDIVASLVDITPEYPVVAGGHLEVELLATVSERLEANLVVLRSGVDSDPVVIISLDLLYPGRILRTALESALPELRPDQIFLAASHTHQAPMTDDTKSLIGVPDDRYMEMLALRLSGEVRRMFGSDQTASGTIFTSTLTAKHSINRRLKRRLAIARKPRGRLLPARWSPVFNTQLMAPNADGVTGEVLNVLISRSPSGEAQFVIWNYACHPLAFPDRTRIAADYPPPRAKCSSGIPRCRGTARAVPSGLLGQHAAVCDCGQGYGFVLSA